MKNSSVRWLTIAVLSCVLLYSLTRLEMTNSITHFIPTETNAELVDLSVRLVESPLARRMLISVSGGNESKEAALLLKSTLSEHPEIEWVESDFNEQAAQEIYQIYFNRRFYMASSNPELDIPKTLEAEELSQKAKALKSRLQKPNAMLAARTAPEDPLGLFETILKRIQSAKPESTTPPSRNFYVFAIGLASSPFDAQSQTTLLEYIDEEFQALRDRYGNHLKLEKSGVNVFAVSTERSVRRDGNLISIIVIFIVSLLFLLVFRSLQKLAIAISIPIFGFSVAMALAVSNPEPVHGITLAFGFVLIGVAIDYAIHIMSHHALSDPSEDPHSIIKNMRPSLLLSAFTTTVAFSALAFSDFPGLSEMGTFAAVGIPVSLLISLYSLPAFLPKAEHPTQSLLRLATTFDSLILILKKRKWIAYCILGTGVIISVSGIPRLQWQDNPSALMTVDPELYAESERVRDQVADFDGGRFVVGLADSAEQALILNDEIARRLQRVSSTNALGGIGSLHSFLWSQELQNRNLEAFQHTPNLRERIDEAYEDQGFQPNAFHAFDRAIAQPTLPALEPKDLENSPLRRAAGSLVAFDDRWAVVTYLKGVQSPSAIRESIAEMENTHFVDQQSIMSEIYTDYRRSTIRAIFFGSLLIFIVLQLRYRNFIRGLLAFTPPSLACLTALGILGLLDIPVTVVSAISLLVVLGMGVDYGIFSVDTGRRGDKSGTTLSGLLISCLTSTFVFGFLGFAGQPVLRSIGLTTGIGILLAFFFAVPALTFASSNVLQDEANE